jgi:hypothetical protein
MLAWAKLRAYVEEPTYAEQAEPDLDRPGNDRSGPR